ncbi:Reverse transcriptase domain-containing protein [Aphis craccivora]|uniref:Reverse transcriptase domain-containing protein n=1 Tax=Aphis craccivora TaxID=307492 RepID=A0A6G0Y9L0_APHCR|nr:Reverse transcriptase domain-containing protein [Aphis craccivora]
MVIRNRPLGLWQTIKPSDNRSFPIDMSSHGHQSTLICHKCRFKSRSQSPIHQPNSNYILLKT